MSNLLLQEAKWTPAEKSYVATFVTSVLKRNVSECGGSLKWIRLLRSLSLNLRPDFSVVRLLLNYHVLHTLTNSIILS